MQKSSISFKTELEKAIINKLGTKLKVAAAQVAARAIELMRERTSNKGLDVNGQRLPKYSSKYEKFKKKYIAGRIKKLPTSIKKKYPPYDAKSMPNHGRLSGRLFNFMSYKQLKYKYKNGKFEIGFEMYNTNKQRQDVIKYLKQRGRDIEGIAIKGNRKTYELKELEKTFNKYIN